MVPLGLPRGERSEDRERIFLAGEKARLSEGLSRAKVPQRREKRFGNGVKNPIGSEAAPFFLTNARDRKP
jgi:hypothetical protein